MTLVALSALAATAAPAFARIDRGHIVTARLACGKSWPRRKGPSHRYPQESSPLQRIPGQQPSAWTCRSRKDPDLL